MSNMLTDSVFIVGYSLCRRVLYAVNQGNHCDNPPTTTRQMKRRIRLDPGPNSALIDIMALRQFINLHRKLMLATAAALKPEPAAIYLPKCIMLT